MRLDHLDLHVPDVLEARDFFVAHFGLVSVETRGAGGLAILHDDTGLELVISRPIDKFGVELRSPPREMRGMWLFYCFAPGRILVEVRAP